MIQSIHKYLLIILDLFFFAASFYVAALIVKDPSFSFENVNHSFPQSMTINIIFFSFVGIIVFRIKNLYKLNVCLSTTHQLLLIFLSVFYTVILLTFIAFILKSTWLLNSRLIVIYFSIFSITSIALYRIVIFRTIFALLNKKKIVKRKVIVVGSDIIAQSFAVEMHIDNIYGFDLVGFIDNKYPVGKRIFRELEILGTIDAIPDVVDKYHIDEIIVAESDMEYDELLKIIDMAKQTPARINVASQLFSIVHNKISLDSYFEIPIAPIRKKLQSEYLWLTKRVIDVIGVVFGFIVLLVPCLVIALIIKVTSPGPVLYKQVRIGKDGRPFDFYKFRSMEVGSDRDDSRKKIMHDFIKGNTDHRNGSTKVVNDHQVTRIGRFLRKTSIDELPQLFNVLKGDMSLVGPRPCLPYEYEAYDNWHKRRLTVLPGCTGLWQVSSRSETGFNEMVVLDLYYIGNISLLLDIQLILKTIPVMLMGRGGK